MKPRSKKLRNENLIGARVVEIRNAKKMKQKDLLARLQLSGIEISATSLSRLEELEEQQRKTSDYELVALSEALCVGIRKLLGLCVKCDRMGKIAFVRI